jgi:hypothetical protein
MQAEEAQSATPASQGNSASAPGQTKAEQAATPATANSASAPGQSKVAQAATPAKGNSVQAHANVAANASAKANAALTAQKPATPELQQNGEGHLRTNHKKVLICHSTGSESNPFVVVSVSVNGLKSGHDKLETREAVLSATATQPRETADVHSGRKDKILGPSSPGSIENRAQLKAGCARLSRPRCRSRSRSRCSSSRRSPSPQLLPRWRQARSRACRRL